MANQPVRGSGVPYFFLSFSGSAFLFWCSVLQSTSSRKRASSIRHKDTRGLESWSWQTRENGSMRCCYWYRFFLKIKLVLICVLKLSILNAAPCRNNSGRCRMCVKAKQYDLQITQPICNYYKVQRQQMKGILILSSAESTCSFKKLGQRLFFCFLLRHLFF